MNANRTIAVLCALCALSALSTHARVFDVRHVGDDSSSTASPNPTSPSPTSPASTSPTTSPAGPTASTPRPAHPYCQTCQVVGEQRYQLIRGGDEVQQCTDHNYCDCLEHKQLQCEGLLSTFRSFDPDTQECRMGFSCADYLSKHPAPPAPTPTTPTSGSTTVQSTTTSPPASNPTTKSPTTRSPTTKSPPTQTTAASKAPNPSTTPGTTAKPSSAWANRATALTVVCLAALAAL